MSTGGWPQLDPGNCHNLEAMRMLDFAGYGTIYPGQFTVEFDVYCSDVSQSPFVRLWNSGPVETHHGWNYIQVDPPLPFLDGCVGGPDSSDFGCIEWVLTLCISCSGASAAQPSTWGNIKAMYR